MIDGVIGDDAKVAAVVAFMKSLTDERVRRQAAPFDHPSLVIYDGSDGSSEGLSRDVDVFLPAVGRAGAAPLKSFEEVLK